MKPFRRNDGGKAYFRSLFCVPLFLIVGCFRTVPDNTERVFLASTFPVYQLVRNVTVGVPGVRVDLLLPASTGCPHDYALTPQDRRKLESSDVLIINGLGLEEFMGPLLERSGLHVIDSSQGLDDLLPLLEKHHEHGGKASPSDVNPHLFVSPERSAQLARVIAMGLSEVDPVHGDLFKKNADIYAQRMGRWMEEFRTRRARWPNTRVASLHNAFDYFLKDVGLTQVGVLQIHPGQAPALSDIGGLVRLMKKTKTAVLITQTQYSDRLGRTVSQEAGVPTVALDAGANGPENASLDYFETVLDQNLKNLDDALKFRE